MHNNWSAENSFQVSRLEIATIATIDPGWFVEKQTESRFMHDRGRAGWVRGIAARLKPTAHGFSSVQISKSAYARSSEHGRPTFSTELLTEFMPIEFLPSARTEYLIEKLAWHADLVRIHNNGAITFQFVAFSTAAISPKALIRSYHAFRQQLSLNMPSVALRVFQMWNECLPEYAIASGAAVRVFERAELYDVVDFDFTIDGKRAAPKDIYKYAELGALRCLAGISRMSLVFDSYSKDSLAAFYASDLGGRDDELWVPNAERLIRHHPEHMTDEAKRMYWLDVITAIDVLLAERATLNLLVSWAKRLRANFLDELTTSGMDNSGGQIMRGLLREIASCTDLYHELPSISRATGSSFFGKLLETIEGIRATRQIQSEVSESISQALDIANAIFAERTAAAAQRSSDESLEIAKASKTVAVAATFAALVALVVAVLQLWVAIYPPGGAVTTSAGAAATGPSASAPVALGVAADGLSSSGAVATHSTKIIGRE